MFLIRVPHLGKAVSILLLMLIAAICHGADNPFDVLNGQTLAVRIELLSRTVQKIDETYSPAKTRELLDKERVIAETRGDKQLAYLIRLWQLKKMTSPQLPDPVAEKEFLSIIDELKGEAFLPTKLLAYHLLADHYWWRRDYGRSFEYEFTAFDIYKNLDFDDHPEMRMYYFQLAGRYYGFRDYENTKRLLLSIPEKSLSYDYPGPELYYNLLGLCYRNLERYDSAVYYLEKGYLKAVEKNNHIYAAIIKGNIGISYYYQKRFKEAIPLLEADIQYCLEKNRATDNAAKSMAVLADVYFQLGNIPKASELLYTSLGIVWDGGFSNKFKLMDFIYPIMAKVLAKQGNISMAYRFMDSTRIIKDSLDKEKNTLILARAQNLVSAQTHLSEVRQLNDQKKMQVLIRNSILTGVILIGILMLLFINRQRISNRRKQEKLEAEKQLVATELSNAEVQLKMFTKSIHEKNALLEEFSAQLETMQTSGTDDIITYEPETMARLRESTILTDEEWENFRRLFEKVHSGFLERLRIKIPGLSPAETRFIALAKLHLSNKEMAGTLGISTDAVRMNKHRLRKKLNLPEETTIEELIERL
jgi:tetratricopeptide (TPR) repeat protein/DNA-binding CsgD family transcriptional regulator